MALRLMALRCARENVHEQHLGSSLHPGTTATATIYFARRAGSLLLLVLLAGCGESFPDTVRVRGTVTHQGKPVAGTITFHPARPPGEQLYRPAVGVLAEDGTYQLQSFRHGDGIMPGEYAVVIESYEVSPSAEDTDWQPIWLIPQKYGNSTTSGLTATIPAEASGRLELDFDLP